MNVNAEAYEDNVSAWSESSAPMHMQEQLEIEMRRREELEEQVQSMTETIYTLEEETCNAVALEEHVKEVESENVRLKEIASRFWVNIKDLIDRTWPDGPGSESKLCEQINDFANLLKSFLEEMDLDGDNSMTSKEDVLWFVKELSWRFEKIADMEHHHRSNSKNSFLQLLHHQTKNGLPLLAGENHILPPAVNGIEKLERSNDLMNNETIQKQEEKIKSLEETVQNLTQQLQNAQKTIETNDEKYQSHLHQQNQQLQLSKSSISSLESALKSLHLEYNSLRKRRTPPPSASTQQEEEIIKLAMALEKSELNRAKLLEEFQEERRENARNIQRLMEKFQTFVKFNDY